MQSSDFILNIYKVLGLGGFSFFLGVALAPILTHYLYLYKLWRKDVKELSPDGSGVPIFQSLHPEDKIKVPRMGGILIWGTTLIVALIFLLLSIFFSDPLFYK